MMIVYSNHKINPHVVLNVTVGDVAMQNLSVKVWSFTHRLCECCCLLYAVTLNKINHYQLRNSLHKSTHMLWHFINYNMALSR